MQHFLAVFFPPLALLAFLAGLLILIGRLVVSVVRKANADRKRIRAQARAADLQTADRLNAIGAACDAVAAVIAELQARPATYQTFPEEVRHLLYVAHEKSHHLIERIP